MCPLTSPIILYVPYSVNLMPSQVKTRLSKSDSSVSSFKLSTVSTTIVILSSVSLLSVDFHLKTFVRSLPSTVENADKSCFAIISAGTTMSPVVVGSFTEFE